MLIHAGYARTYSPIITCVITSEPIDGTWPSGTLSSWQLSLVSFFVRTLETSRISKSLLLALEIIVVCRDLLGISWKFDLEYVAELFKLLSYFK